MRQRTLEINISIEFFQHSKLPRQPRILRRVLEAQKISLIAILGKADI